MAQVQAAALPSIEEEEEVVLSELDRITDPGRLKKLRSGGRTTNNKSGKKLVQAVGVGEDRDTVRAQRAVYVRDFDNLERRHDRYVSVKYGSSSNEETEGEKQWIKAVIYENQGTLSMCDTYLAQTKPESSISSRISSKRSSISYAQAKIREAERKEQEALLRL
jgi:hypothetical protein